VPRARNKDLASFPYVTDRNGAGESDMDKVEVKMVNGPRGQFHWRSRSGELGRTCTSASRLRGIFANPIAVSSNRMSISILADHTGNAVEST